MTAPLDVDALERLLAEPGLAPGSTASAVIVTSGELRALIANTRALAEVEEEQRLFDEDAAEKQRLIDYIADKIGLPQDQELDTTNFGLWLSGRAEVERKLGVAAEDAFRAGWRAHETGYAGSTDGCERALTTYRINPEIFAPDPEDDHA